MSTPFSQYAAQTNIYSTPTQNPSQSPTIPFTPGTPTPASRGRPRGSAPGTGAKRGRKPRGSSILGTTGPRILDLSATQGSSTSTSQQYPRVQWAIPKANSPSSPVMTSNFNSAGGGSSPNQGAQQGSGVATLGAPESPSNTTQNDQSSSTSIVAPMSGTINLVTGEQSQLLPTSVRPQGVDEDGEGDDELLPAMADDDYSAQLSFQSQSKDNLKVLMDNFSPAQYDRFEAYRRHALPKQAVRKVIQQTLGQQVSQPVAQIIAGFSKVFVGEIVEKARAVQNQRGEIGPLSPDHLREAYRAYQEETGRVGAARPLKSKKLFVR